MATEKEIQSLERIVEKLDESVDKLTAISADIGKLLAVHDQRLNTVEKDTVRNEDDIRDLHFKIESMVKDLSSKIDQSMENSKEGHEKIQQSINEKLQGYDNRIRTLEIWRWLIIGGAIATGWIFNKFFK
jgi:chromosome segregation ATPase